jgi:hypothetical protein
VFITWVSLALIYVLISVVFSPTIFLVFERRKRANFGETVFFFLKKILIFFSGNSTQKITFEGEIFDQFFFSFSPKRNSTKISFLGENFVQILISKK